MIIKLTMSNTVWSGAKERQDFGVGVDLHTWCAPLLFYFFAQLSKTSSLWNETHNAILELIHSKYSFLVWNAKESTKHSTWVLTPYLLIFSILFSALFLPTEIKTTIFRLPIEPRILNHRNELNLKILYVEYVCL